MLYRVPHLQIYLEGQALSIAVGIRYLKLLIWVLETRWKKKQFCFTGETFCTTRKHHRLRRYQQCNQVARQTRIRAGRRDLNPRKPDRTLIVQPVQSRQQLLQKDTLVQEANTAVPVIVQTLLHGRVPQVVLAFR